MKHTNRDDKGQFSRISKNKEIESEFTYKGITYEKGISNNGLCTGCAFFSYDSGLTICSKENISEKYSCKGIIWVKKEIAIAKVIKKELTIEPTKPFEIPSLPTIHIANYILNHFDKNSHADHICLARYLEQWRDSFTLETRLTKLEEKVTKYIQK